MCLPVPADSGALATNEGREGSSPSTGAKRVSSSGQDVALPARRRRFESDYPLQYFGHGLPSGQAQSCKLCYVSSILTPCSTWGRRSTGRAPGLHPGDAGSIPVVSTICRRVVQRREREPPKLETLVRVQPRGPEHPRLVHRLCTCFTRRHKGVRFPHRGPDLGKWAKG